MEAGARLTVPSHWRRPCHAVVVAQHNGHKGKHEHFFGILAKRLRDCGKGAVVNRV